MDCNLCAGFYLDEAALRGWARSMRQTLLGMLLDHHPDFAFVGEVMHLWDQWGTDTPLCSCGELLSKCVFWSRVVARYGDRISAAERAEFFEVQSAACRTVKIPLWALEGWRERELARYTRYISGLSSLYNSIFRESKKLVVVDTSKVPTYGLLLKAVSELEVYVLHMIRDPRAVAYSWTRRRPKTPGTNETVMEMYSPLRSALRWDVYNAGIPLLHKRGRYMALTYEELIKHPQQAINAIVRYVGGVNDSAWDPDLLKTRPSQTAHVFSGNPNRFTKNPIRIKPDDEWRTKMRRIDRRLVSSATWPLRRVYGYD